MKFVTASFNFLIHLQMQDDICISYGTIFFKMGCVKLKMKEIIGWSRLKGVPQS